jgi:Leucine-rich repeat (LRR) protein
MFIVIFGAETVEYVMRRIGVQARLRLVCGAACLLALWSASPSPAAGDDTYPARLVFKDPNLEAVVRKAAPSGDLTPEAVKSIKMLDCVSANITDLSGIEQLTSLRTLRLSENRITDLGPLAANNGLDKGDTVKLAGNPLSDLSKKTYIPQLKARGVTVIF